MDRPIRAALVAVSLAACGGDDAPGADAGPDAFLPSDLAWVQQNVFTPSCAAFASCHDGAMPESNLDLTTEAMSEAGLVGVASLLEPGMLLVAPGDHEQSYLMVILGHFGEDDPRIDPVIGTMPFNNPILSAEKRDAVARWIDSLPAAAR